LTRPTPAFALVTALLIVLWLAGGASRADVMGQALVRVAAWLVLIAAILAGQTPDLRNSRLPAALLAAAIVLIALQLVPLPPPLWMALPGREIFVRAAEVAGETQPWRPMSISPALTLNSLMSLVVPAVVLYLATRLEPDEHWRLLKLIAVLIAASALLALTEFTGQSLDHPFVNDIPKMISANFANRNHLALWLSFGIVASFALASNGRMPKWAGVAAIVSAVFLGLGILATGSRAGLLLALVAAIIGVALGRDALSTALKSLSPRARIVSVAAVAAFVAGLLALAISFDRAASFDRVTTLSVEDDLRIRSQPFVIRTLVDYFPVGAGFGTFDPAYRINEPDELLSPKYLNRAHNDWVEVVFEGGLVGAALLIAALGWFLAQSYRVWRNEAKPMLPRIGSAFIGLTMIASAFDYPARTPLIMALLAIAAVWLSARQERPRSSPRSSESALRTDEPSL
jgi:O-antigen ligase